MTGIPIKIVAVISVWDMRKEELHGKEVSNVGDVKTEIALSAFV